MGGFWSEKLSYLDNYSRFVKRDKPLPPWSSSDVERFIASDPVHGPTVKMSMVFISGISNIPSGLCSALTTFADIIQLKTAREAASYAAAGSLLGAVSTAGVAWKYSKSLHGTGLSFLAGGVFGWTFGHEFANHFLQLYRLDTMTAQVKFLEWWEKKSGERSS